MYWLGHSTKHSNVFDVVTEKEGSTLAWDCPMICFVLAGVGPETHTHKRQSLKFQLWSAGWDAGVA